MWVNFPEIARTMKRGPAHLFDFFLDELNTTGSLDGRARFIIRGTYLPQTIDLLLDKYVKEYEYENEKEK